jgi:transcriptional regulator with XRE-family HTH domain
MPQKPTFKLPPLNLGNEPIGQRIARLRKVKGYTQTDLAKELSQGEASEREIHNVRVLISDYERNKIRPNYEMVIRLALAFGVTADELLGIKPSKNKNNKPNLKIQKRMKNIEKLPAPQQKTLLKTIDTFLKAAQL